MTKEAKEWMRLNAYRLARKPQHQPLVSSKRHMKKGIGKARGQRFLKNGYITETVHMETVFKPKP